MMVRALVSFVARIDGNTLNIQAGQLVDLPAGADWLAAGLVAPVPGEEVETAVVDAADVERAVTRKRKR